MQYWLSCAILVLDIVYMVYMVMANCTKYHQTEANRDEILHVTCARLSMGFAVAEITCIYMLLCLAIDLLGCL